MAKVRTALITGIFGQDGAYLARLLAGAGVRVIGQHRPGANADWRLGRLGIRESVSLVGLEFDDSASFESLLKSEQPDFIFHLAAHSDVGVSFDRPVETIRNNGLGAIHLLEAMRRTGSYAKLVNASSGAIFDSSTTGARDEASPLGASDPYAMSKLVAHLAVATYRMSYGLWASNAILFNHESELRGESFVTRKITLGIARCAARGGDPVALGNLDTVRDWSHAEDVVEAMWRMAQLDQPSDFVIASGVANTVRGFAEEAAAVAGFDLRWEGVGLDETGVDTRTGQVLVRIDPRFFRPSGRNEVVGNPAKARNKLAWDVNIPFQTLVQRMVEHDLEQVRQNPDS